MSEVMLDLCLTDPLPRIYMGHRVRGGMGAEEIVANGLITRPAVQIICSTQGALREI